MTVDPFRFSRLWLVKCSIVLALGSGGSAAGQELKEFDLDYLQSPADGPELEEAEEEIVRRTNEFRRQQGLNELNSESRLRRAAGYFAAYMARTNKYGHGADGNRPSERVSLFDYDYCIVAENIAFQLKSTGFETKELARKFFEGWKESPEHRENMLRPHATETGVAIGHAPGSDRYYAVQLFGRPRSEAIEFQITNRTGETIQYTVDAAGNGDSESRRRTFDLPPRATMFHTRCLPTTIDWGWTEKADGLKPSNGQKYAVTKSDSGYEVSRQPEGD